VAADSSNSLQPDQVVNAKCPSGNSARIGEQADAARFRIGNKGSYGKTGLMTAMSDDVPVVIVTFS